MSILSMLNSGEAGGGRGLGLEGGFGRTHGSHIGQALNIPIDCPTRISQCLKNGES